MLELIVLGFGLSLDNFRSSLILGGLKPSFMTSVKTSAIFGVWDGIAPIAGILIGEFLTDRIEGFAETIATAGLLGYGIFLVLRSLTTPERADPDLHFARTGLPLPLSVDNVAAGAALGLAGYNPWLAPILFGIQTFIMSVVGHQIGRLVASGFSSLPKINTDLLTGICFIVVAVLALLGVALPLSETAD